VILSLDTVGRLPLRILPDADWKPQDANDLWFVELPAAAALVPRGHTGLVTNLAFSS
jgi:hypothetical protein